MRLKACEADSVASATCSAILTPGGAAVSYRGWTPEGNMPGESIITEQINCDECAVDGDVDEDEVEDVSCQLPCGGSCLSYDSFLAHQRYYDDFKHSNHKFISYTFDDGNNPGMDTLKPQLVVEQNVSLGKGGICWDAGFILAEHLIRTQAEWSKSASLQGRRPRILELGAGTGLTGLALAQHCDCEVVLTDLPDFLPILNRNLEANGLAGPGGAHVRGTARVAELSWGVTADIAAIIADGAFDVIIGADCVYSLVDREALARTIVELSNPSTLVYLTMKQRLPELEESFAQSICEQFPQMTMLEPSSRNVNPGMRLWLASGRHCCTVSPAA